MEIIMQDNLSESRRLRSIFHENRKRKLYEFEYTDDGLTEETAYNFISAAFKLNGILGYKNYGHSDFTSILVGNTFKENQDWARYIGTNFAIFENDASKGYVADLKDTLNIISRGGRYGLAVDWSAGAGGGNSNTELAERFFGGYYKFSSCLQQAFGGPKSGVWKDEKVALNFIKWSETVESITDFIKSTPLRKNAALFTELKNFMLNWSQAINEKLVTIDVANLDDSERFDLGSALAIQTLDEIEVPESLQNLEDFKIDNSSSTKYIWLRVGKSTLGADIVKNKETGEYEFIWAVNYARKFYTMEELIDFCGKNIKFTNSFDPATFAAGQY